MSQHRPNARRHASPPEPIMGGWVITVVCLSVIALVVVLAVLL